MKKAFIIILVLISAISPLFSSDLYVGIEAGYNYSIVHSNTGWSNTYELNGHGFDVTVPIEYKLTDWFSLNSGVRFTMKSSIYEKYQTIGFETPFLSNHYANMHYVLDFPITARFSLSNETFGGFIGCGVYLGLRLFDILSGTTIGIPDGQRQYHTEVRGLSSDANYFDAGLIAEAGVTFSPADKGYLYLLARYQYGFTSLSRDYKLASHIYFDNICISLGYMFNL